MYLVWGGDQQRLPLAYDVVATIVLLWRPPIATITAGSRMQTYPNRLWCIWELFTLLATSPKEQALERIRSLLTRIGSQQLTATGRSEAPYVHGLCKLGRSGLR